MQEEMEQTVPTTMLKMSLPCSRCKNLISLRCCEERRVYIECGIRTIDDTFSNIFNLTIGCPKYNEDLDILRSCLSENE